MKVQPLRSSGSACSSNTTCNSHSGCPCIKPVQPVATQLFILVRLLQSVMQLLMSQDESELHKRLTAEAGNKLRPWCKQCRILHIWKARIPLKQKLQTTGSENVNLCLCVWRLGFLLQLLASERSNMNEDNINMSKGYKSLLIWKPRLTKKERIFRK